MCRHAQNRDSSTVQADMDYTPLRDALAQGNFQEADDITRANLIKLAGPDAEKKGWVYFTEVKFISSTDLQTIDKLWRAATNNRCNVPSVRSLFQIRPQHHYIHVSECNLGHDLVACVVGVRHQMLKPGLGTYTWTLHASTCTTSGLLLVTGKVTVSKRRSGCKIASSGPSFSSR